MSQLSNYLENKLIEHTLRNVDYTSPAAVYVALYTDDPTDADAGSEVVGNAYARQAATFGAASNGVCTTTADITFPVANGGNWGTITHVGIRDADTGGNLLFFGPLAVSKTINEGDQFKILTGNLTATLA